MVFISSVVGAMLSGWVALVPTKTECMAMDRLVCKFARFLRKGAACIKTLMSDGSTHYMAQSRLEVWRWLRWAGARRELQIQRLRMWQEIFGSWQTRHINTVAAVMGDFEWEPERTFTEEGHIHKDANPWLQQLGDDLMETWKTLSLESLELDVGSRPWEFLVEKEYVERFAAIDLAQLRAYDLSHAIPPPGDLACAPQGGVGAAGCGLPEAAATETRHREIQEHDEKPYLCILLNAAGSVCNERFETRARLIAHQTASRGGEHGQRSVVRACVVGNQCPACRTLFASRKIAQDHIVSAERNRACPKTKPQVQHAFIPPKKLECQSCEVSFPDADAMCSHMVLVHLPFLSRPPGLQIDIG